MCVRVCVYWNKREVMKVAKKVIKKERAEIELCFDDWVLEEEEETVRQTSTVSFSTWRENIINNWLWEWCSVVSSFFGKEKGFYFLFRFFLHRPSKWVREVVNDQKKTK